MAILDGEIGYLTVNKSSEVFPGWHGGPTISESYVPLVFAMPGNNFVESGGANIDYPPEFVRGYNNGIAQPQVQLTVSSPGDGFTRNWQLPHILKKVIAEFRDE